MKKITKIFKVKNHICVILEVCDWYCGYVEFKYPIHYSELYSYCHSEEPTFSGKLALEFDGWFIGYDQAHLWDKEHPESCTLEATIERLKQFAEEVIEAENKMKNEKEGQNVAIEWSDEE